MKVKKDPQIYLQSGNFLANQGKHEEALTEFYKYVEKRSNGPYLDLYSRTSRPGWVGVGNQAGKWKA